MLANMFLKSIIFAYSKNKKPFLQGPTISCVYGIAYAFNSMSLVGMVIGVRLLSCLYMYVFNSGNKEEGMASAEQISQPSSSPAAPKSSSKVGLHQSIFHSLPPHSS